MIKKISLTVIVCFLVVVNLHYANAQTSLDYYKGLFNSWGIPVDTLPQKNTKLDVPSTKRDLQTLLQIIEGKESEQRLAEEQTINADKEGRYLLLLVSQFNDKPQIENGMLGYKNVILVCDSPETAFLPQGISCASDKLNFADQNPVESSVSDKILQTAQPLNVNGVKYYVLPQALLITPQYQKNLGDYFKALSQAQNSSNVFDNQQANVALTNTLLKKIKDASIFESTIYALALLLFVTVLRKLISIAANNPRKLLEKNLYVDQMCQAINFLSKNSGLISFIFLVLAIFYIPIFYALSIKAGLLGDSSYPIKYLSTTLDPINIPKYLTAKNLFRIGLLFYHYALTLFGLFLILPSLVKVSVKSAQKISEVKLKTGFVKWLIPVIIVLNGLLLAFVDLKSLVGFLSLSMMVLLMLLLYLKRQQIVYSNLFSKKERWFPILAMFIVLSLNAFYPLFQKGQPTRYSYEPLIGIKDKVIAFPYSKKWNGNVLFEPHYYKGSSKVYADGYLIYSPNSEQIVNKPLNKFSNAENFTIVSGKPDKVVEALLKKTALQNYLSTAEFSPLFIMNTISDDEYNPPALKIRININCSLAQSPTVVKLETLTLNKFMQNDINTDPNTTINPNTIVDAVTTESTEIMNFPGCKTDTGTETFEIPLNLYIIPRDFAVFRIKGINEKALTALKIFAGEKEIPIKFINKEVLNESQYTVLHSSDNLPKEITNYSTEIKKDFQVNIKGAVKDSQGFDLSKPINELMKRSLLRNPFIIWTDKSNEIIQNL